MQPRRSSLAAFLSRTLAAGIGLAAAIAPPAWTTAAHARQDPAAPAANLPDAREIIAKSIEAIGGKEAWTKRTTMEMKGTIELAAQGMKGKMLSRTGQPNRMVTEMELEGLGAFRTGFDGKVGWSSDKIQGTRLMAGKELETIAREADYLKDVDPMSRWDTIKTVADEKFGGFDCWKLEATRSAKRPDGTEAKSSATMWYEKSTYLLRGYATVLETSIGALPMSTTFVEYKDFDGIKLPVRTEAMQAGQKIVTMFETITFDAVPESAFALPKEVQALLEPEPADEGDEAAEGADGTGTSKTTPADAKKKNESPAAPAKP
jgi:hypothetical protein